MASLLPWTTRFAKTIPLYPLLPMSGSANAIFLPVRITDGYRCTGISNQREGIRFTAFPFDRQRSAVIVQTSLTDPIHCVDDVSAGRGVEGVRNRSPRRTLRAGLIVGTVGRDKAAISCAHGERQRV